MITKKGGAGWRRNNRAEIEGCPKVRRSIFKKAYRKTVSPRNIALEILTN